MRYGIFSDVHSNLEALEAVLDAFKKEKIDKLLCIGDVVGYASNPRECIKEIEAIAAVTVAGNHDWASVDLFAADYFNPVALQAIDWTRKNLGAREHSFLESLKLVYKNNDLTLVHGTLNDPQEFNYLTDGFLAEESFELLETDICFVGHTHVPGVFVKENNSTINYQEVSRISIFRENKYIVNVGSVGQPRDGNPQAAFCIYDTDKKEVLIKRAGYGMELTKKKIIEAGLSGYLGDRLLAGR